MDCIVPIVTKISEYTIQGIVHHVGYVVFCHRNMEDLKEQVANLESAKSGVQNLIEEAENNAEDIEDMVLAWLTKVDEIIEKANKFPRQGEETQRSCWNWSYLNLAERHSLGRKAKELAKEVGDIHRQGKFNKVSYRGPLPGIENSGFQNFESRKSTVGKIMEALRHSDINRIGVYGMGGVGKTMLVKEIARDVQKEKLFGEVIMATVGQNQNVENIQGQLGDMLELKFNSETRQGRAALLRKRLRTGKKILIILDDIWNGLDFETVGIPCSDDYEGCKLLVSSRSKHVLSNKMGIEKNFEVQALNNEEAWEFFKNMIGEESIETDHELKKIANKVVAECGKLPIALVTVAKALKRKSLPIWRDALRQLQSPATIDIEGVAKEVYASLKLSYDYLSSEDAKKIFLFCSIFPDDYNIYMEALTLYAIGLKFIQGVNTLREATDRILKLVDDLKSCCLLQSSVWFRVGRQVRYFGNGYVTMHDVIRDVAIYIASRDDQICTFSYVKELDEWRDEDTHGPYKMVLADCVNFQNLPRKLNFPLLELLALVNVRGYRKHHIQIQEEFFGGMEKLRVLQLEKMHLPHTPSLFQSLSNVRMLILINCQLGNIDRIGELKNLEVLDLSQSDIMSLPLSMSQLIRLKQLNVSRCEQLKVIPVGVISKLTKLEVLLMENSFNVWEVDFNAIISELDHLRFLTFLSLCIPDEKYLPKNAFSKNVELEHFRIFIGKPQKGYSLLLSRRVLGVNMNSRNFIFKGAGINKLLQKSEELELGVVDVKDVFVELNRSGDAPNVRTLIISRDESVEWLISEFDMALSCKALAKLESLLLWNMMGLKSIVQSSIRTIKVFENIESICVSNCHKLRHLFSVSIMEGLSKLESIYVLHCEMMEAIVVMEDEEATDKIECKQLRILELVALPRLMHFCVKLNRGLIQTSEEAQQIVANSMTTFEGKLVFRNLKVLSIKDVPNDTWCSQLITNDFNIQECR